MGLSLKNFAIVTGIAIILAGFWTLQFVRITLNGTASLPDNAYVMWTWPKRITYGTIISAPTPEVFEEVFGGYYFTKKVVGLPGDEISHSEDGSVCVNNKCFKLVEQDGEPFAPAISEGVIPEGKYAAFGDSEDSLDSRYQIVGLFAKDDIYAVGFGTNIIPHWTDIKAWTER